MSKQPTAKQLKIVATVPIDFFEEMERDAGMGIPDNETESGICDLEDPLSGISFGLPLIEKFLLSVIDAHFIEGLDRRQRLNAAMTALVNRDASHGPLPPDPNKGWIEQEVTLEKALLWMGTKYGLAGRKKPSDLSLAEEAAVKFFPTVDHVRAASRINDLRKRFGGSYDKRLKSWNADCNVDVRRTYAYRATQHDYLRESVEHQILRRIRDEFAAAGVRMILPDE